MIKNTIIFCYLDSHLGSFHVCVFINFRFRSQSFKYKKSVICIWKVIYQLTLPGQKTKMAAHKQENLYLSLYTTLLHDFKGFIYVFNVFKVQEFNEAILHIV